MILPAFREHSGIMTRLRNSLLAVWNMEISSTDTSWHSFLASWYPWFMHKYQLTCLHYSSGLKTLTVRSIMIGWPSRSTLWKQSPPMVLAIRITVWERPGLESTLPSSIASYPRTLTSNGSLFWRVAQGKRSMWFSLRQLWLATNCFFAASYLIHSVIQSIFIQSYTCHIPATTYKIL